jgi:hypothetical protein
MAQDIFEQLHAAVNHIQLQRVNVLFVLAVACLVIWQNAIHSDVVPHAIGVLPPDPM